MGQTTRATTAELSLGLALLALPLSFVACGKERNFESGSGSLQGPEMSATAPDGGNPPAAAGGGVVDPDPPDSNGVGDGPGGNADADCRSVACDSPLVCDEASGACVECLDSSQCLYADSARCETSPSSPIAFQCAGCASNRDCAGKPEMGGLCRATDGVCVSCLTNAECSGNASASACSAGGTCALCNLDADCSLIVGQSACAPGQGCVECTDNAHCASSAGRPFCKTANISEAAGGLPANTCVECVSNTDCTNPDASQCQNNQCVPCSVDAECAHIDSTPNAAGGTPLNVCDAGSCVQCTGLRREACGANVCDSLTRQCTAFAAGGADLCEPCLSDAHCDPDARCILQTLGAQSIGYACFPVQAPGQFACPTRGFAGQATIASMDTPSQDVCLQRATSCSAYLNYEAGTTCDPEGDDATCGPSGTCGAMGRCTISCDGISDCISGMCIDDLCSL